MPETAPPPDWSAMSLSDMAAALANKHQPPVDRWNPTHCGDSDMRIARDGTWFHQGAPITRPAMVRLFSTILRRESDGSYVLVTPVEKLDIAVEDAPFVAVEVKSEGTGPARRIMFRLNTDDVVCAGPDNPIRIDDRADGPHPYALVRPGLEARIARPAYYDLAEIALEEGSDPPGVWSAGAFFALTAA